MADAMVGKARRAARRVGVENVTFEQGDAEQMPFADGSFDAALVNGIFKTSVGTSRPWPANFARCCAQGLRTVVAEMTFVDPPVQVASIDDWFR
jgi:ubiquinone/menaquinone biosynthesis C-methylase UbiE